MRFRIPRLVTEFSDPWDAVAERAFDICLLSHRDIKASKCVKIFSHVLILSITNRTHRTHVTKNNISFFYYFNNFTTLSKVIISAP